MPELGIGDTATALGVSVDTVRRRMKRGELPARKTPDGRWLVIPTAGAGTLRPYFARVKMNSLRSPLRNSPPLSFRAGIEGMRAFAFKERG